MELEEDLLGDVLSRRPIGKHPVGDGDDLCILLHKQPVEGVRRALINRAQRGGRQGAAPGIELQHPAHTHRRGPHCDRLAFLDMLARRSAVKALWGKAYTIL